MHSYLQPLAGAFQKNANEETAFFMKKYMKGKFDYFGIKSPLRKELKKEFIQKHGLPHPEILPEIVKDCWELPQREFQYFAMDILERLAKKAGKETIQMYEYLILNKSWWDTVDFIAANLAGTHFRKFPESMIPVTRKWMGSENIWLKRSALLFQLKYKKQTDTILMSEYIGQLKGSKEFFINKAIGWLLREYSKTDEMWVRKFVDRNELAPLSKREALKWLDRKSLHKLQ